jgi:ribosome biogenesis GTPase
MDPESNGHLNQSESRPGTESTAQPDSGAAALCGLVVCRTGPKIEVWVPDQHRTYGAVLRGKLRVQETGVYAGDWVLGKPISETELEIDTVQARQNLLPKPHVANVDKLVIVMSWREPEFSHFTLDGLLVLAEFFSLPATIVFTKIDLARTRERKKLDGWVQLYTALGYDVIQTSTETGSGIGQFKDALRGNIVVLAGPSGVGKSSLLNAVIAGARLRVGEVSERTGRGRHTTTEVRLLPNPQGGWVADTPGFQKVDLPQWIAVDMLPRLYREFSQVRCQFNDCSHSIEPGCAVKAALDSGQIRKERYKSYLFWRGAIRAVVGR